MEVKWRRIKRDGRRRRRARRGGPGGPTAHSGRARGEGQGQPLERTSGAELTLAKEAKQRNASDATTPHATSRPSTHPSPTPSTVLWPVRAAKRTPHASTAPLSVGAGHGPLGGGHRDAGVPTTTAWPRPHAHATPLAAPAPARRGLRRPHVARVCQCRLRRPQPSRARRSAALMSLPAAAARSSSSSSICSRAADACVNVPLRRGPAVGAYAREYSSVAWFTATDEQNFTKFYKNFTKFF